MKCWHNTYNDKLQARDVYQPRQSTPVNNEKMERLDALFGQLVNEHESDAPARPLSDMRQADVAREAAVVGDDEIPF
ncbi:MAG: hypothetical protein R3C10_03970 [Pirellulales bacterium]